MAQRAIFLLVAAALLGSAAGASITTLPGGALLKEHAGGGADGKKQSISSLVSEGKQVDDRSEDDQVDDAFQAFHLEHKREYKYGTAEYDMRKALFGRRLLEVHAHNAKPESDRLWEAATSIFSDRTEAELKALRGLKRGAYSPGRTASLLQTSSSSSRSQPRIELPESMSWMNLTTAKLVKNQGGCGSCWAFATISVLESHYEIYKQPEDALRTFSAQQTVDCTPNPRKCGGSGGCDGATVELGMSWILENSLATAEEVAYTGQAGHCTVNGGMPTQVLAESSPNHKGGASFGLLNYSTLPANQGYPLREALVLYGPVAVSAAAGQWFLYGGGVFDKCGKDSVVDHAITAYGYGITDDNKKTKYWNIRNSWGNSWGEGGFIRLLRHDDHDHMTDDDKYCGTDDRPEDGLGCEDGPSSVKVCGMCGILYDSVVPYFHGAQGHGGSSPQTATDATSLSEAMEDTTSLSEAAGDALNSERALQDEAHSAKLKSDGSVASSLAGDTHAVPKLLRAEVQPH